MAATLADIGVYYTGGGANSTPSLSIGGAKSSVQIRFQAGTGLTTLTGVTIDDGFGNTEGDGSLVYTASTTSLTWNGYGAGTGTAVDVSAGGKFFIQSANNGGGLCVTVDETALPSQNVTNTVTIANNTQKLFSDTTKDESDTGVTKYHCFFFVNEHATESMVDITAWRASDTPGADTIAMYLDPLAASDGSIGPTAVANENTAPAASTFVTPTSRTHAGALDLGRLDAGEGVFVWYRQTTPANVTTAYAENPFSTGLYIRG